MKGKKKMKKKIMALCLVAILAITAIGGATLAYFTDTTETAENTFTVGKVDIELDEPSWDDEEHDTVYPGEPLPKDPIVTNVGPNPCFVRVKVDGLKQFGNKGDITLRWIDEDGVYHEGYNTESWELYEDGYYYYKGVLAAKGFAGTAYNEELVEVTPELFSQIVMPTGLTGSEETESIDVTAYAVQAQGAKPSYSAVKAMTVAEIAAWFTTCGF